jgi:Predicted metal-dependent phosphoesterases (PHP family)
VAITDHNETRFARVLQKELGYKVIVGEEIRTIDGEIIGLFLKKTIPPGLSVKETVSEIKTQEGLVYIPHPFETGRNSLQEDILQTIIKEIDVMEFFNGRGIVRGKRQEARKFASDNGIAMAASSDAHCVQGVGTAFSMISEFPHKSSLRKLLAGSSHQTKYAVWYSLLCPGFNKIKNKLFL